jgi:phosphoglycerate dehydrogenase-like enzyme
MSPGRRRHPLWSRRRVLVTPHGSAVANAIQSLILTPMMMLLTLKLSSTPAMMPSQPSEADG